MPVDAVVPQVGGRASGEVLWHVKHNHQVKIRLAEWADESGWGD
jgi:hypothetical protein